MAKDLKIRAYMRRLAKAWDDSEADEFMSVLDEIRLDGSLTAIQRMAVAKTIAQQQAETYVSILSSGAPIELPRNAGWSAEPPSSPPEPESSDAGRALR